MSGFPGQGRGCAVAVLAKAPRPGRVKTRLSPPLLPEEASMMSAAFLRDITANIAAASRDAPITGWVAYAPAGLEALFDGMLEPGTGLVLADGAIEAPPDVQGFGLCLLHAVRALLGTDPDVERLRLRIGAEFVARFRAALGESTDPAVLETVALAFSGALLQAGMGLMTYTEMGERLDAVVVVIMRANT